MPHETMTVMVVSTGHVTPQEAKAFVSDKPPGGLPIALTWEYGWMVYVGTPADQQWSMDIMSDGLRGVIEFAWTRGYEWVRFDCDGKLIESIPAYEW